MAQLISYSPLKNYVGAGLGCRHRTPIEHNRVIFPACPEPKYRAVLQRVYISVAGDERMQNVLALYSGKREHRTFQVLDCLPHSEPRNIHALGRLTNG